MFYFLNNKIILAEDARISVKDLSILRGFAIFDFFRTQHGRPFMIDDYLHRFKTSAQLVGLPLWHSVSDLKMVVDELLKVNKLPEAGIRLVLTGGESHNAYTPAEPNFIILIEENHWPSSEVFTNGIKLITYPYQREFSQVKSINYFNALMLRDKMSKEGAMDILYHNAGELREATRSNFFIVLGKTIVTPDKHILYGITRKKTLELARNNFNVEERTVKLTELKYADECFITGTTKKIMPVVNIDGKPIGNGKRGNATKKLMEMFRDFEEAY
jgi:branched-chain amino acid aminotransferase